jgi:uncharacterized protein (TIGR03435 family)
MKLAALALTVLATAGAQAPNAKPPAFEVASVKPNLNDDVREAIAVQPDGIRFTAFPLRTLIAMAYRSEGIQRFDQLVGGPSLIVDRFDVVARVGAEWDAQGGMPSRLPAMLRTLLRDRFQLRVHTETRKMPAFALLVARRDRRLGPQLRESSRDCAGAGGAQVTTADPDRWCGIRAVGGVITGHAVSVSQLAGNLGGYPTVDRFVTDRTGLTGRYDFRLEYSAGALEPGDTASSTGPSLFTALTEQLGLKLQPEKIVLPVLVIDHIERPTPD